MMRIRAATMMLLAIASAGAAGAADVPSFQNAWYSIEVVIFERNPDTSPTAETLLRTASRSFPLTTRAFIADDSALVYPFAVQTIAEPPLGVNATTPPPAGSASPSTRAPVAVTPQQRAAVLVSEYEATLFDETFRWRSPTTLLLRSEAARLQRSNAYRVVLHGAWVEPVPDRDTPLPMLIQTGDRSTGEWRIQGTLAVTLGRYLHMNAALWYQPDPVAPVEMDSAASEVNPGYFELRETRRMRSGELHYFDHPAFGMLVRIDPVTLPAPLQAQVDALLTAPVPADTPAELPAAPR